MAFRAASRWVRSVARRLFACDRRQERAQLLPTPQELRGERPDEDDEEEQVTGIVPVRCGGHRGDTRGARAPSLSDAIRGRKGVRIIRAIIRERPHAVQEKNSRGQYPLHEAASSGSPLVVLRCLFDFWPNAILTQTTTGEVGNLPLHCVGGKTPAECVDFLLREYPQATEIRNRHGRLPHLSAILNGADIKVVCALVNAMPEAISDSGGNDDLSPARAAARTTGPQQLEVLRYLLERDPEGFSAPCSNGRVLLHDAVEAGAFPDVLEFFRSSPSPGQGFRRVDSGHGPSSAPPAYAAIVNGAPLEVLEYLVVQYDEALQVADKDGYLPLHQAIKETPLECVPAIQQKSFACVKFFVEKWADGLLEADVKGRLPVHLAVGRHWPYFPTVEYLVQKYPDSLRMPDQAGSLPLHAAVAHTATMEVIRFLLKEHPGAINEAKRRGNLPLHSNLPLHIAVAAKYAPSLELTRFLLEASPQAVKALGAKGRLPVHVAFEKKKGYSVRIAHYVVEQWPEAARKPHSDGRFPIHKALTQDDQSFELVRLLLQSCPEALGSQGPDGDLPLHASLSLKEPSLRIVRLIVEESPEASLAVQDASRRTPLHMAISKNTLPFELVQRLVERGPGALLKADTCGSLPLHLVLASKRTSKLKYAECMVKACAESLQELDRDGRTPLAIAAANDAPLDVVHYLLVAWPSALRAAPSTPNQGPSMS